MVEGYPIQANSSTIISVAGFWRVKLPNDKYPDSIRLPHGWFTSRTKFMEYWDAERFIEKELNEWARRQGGRPRKEEPVPPPPYLDAEKLFDDRPPVSVKMKRRRKSE